ncbi:hypothetical protein JCM6882_005285 [Rhodosporidiobolus microsporus]
MPASALSLPIIDISSFLPATRDSPGAVEARKATALQLHEACLHHGFFYLRGFESVVTSSEMGNALDVARSFFARPQEEKNAIKIQQPDGARGYQRLGENKTLGRPDAHEGWDAYHDPLVDDPSRLLGGQNRWPTEPSSFRPAFQRWIEKMHVLGMALMEATAMALGIDPEEDETGEWEKIKGWARDPFWVMRTIGYPPLPKDAEGVSCGAHKDYGNWTLLHADSTQGALQAFLRDPAGESVENGVRGNWVNADPVEGTFVVNIGEMVEIYSAGLYKATLHRVIHLAPNYRVSIPFFYEPSFDAVIEPLPSAIRLRKQLLGSEAASSPIPEPQHYGRFLESKVSGNFYHSPE